MSDSAMSNLNMEEQAALKQLNDRLAKLNAPSVRDFATADDDTTVDLGHDDSDWFNKEHDAMETPHHTLTSPTSTSPTSFHHKPESADTEVEGGAIDKCDQKKNEKEEGELDDSAQSQISLSALNSPPHQAVDDATAKMPTGGIDGGTQVSCQQPAVKSKPPVPLPRKAVAMGIKSRPMRAMPPMPPSQPIGAAAARPLPSFMPPQHAQDRMVKRRSVSLSKPPPLSSTPKKTHPTPPVDFVHSLRNYTPSAKTLKSTVPKPFKFHETKKTNSEDSYRHDTEQSCASNTTHGLTHRTRTASLHSLNSDGGTKTADGSRGGRHGGGGTAGLKSVAVSKPKQFGGHRNSPQFATNERLKKRAERLPTVVAAPPPDRKLAAAPIKSASVLVEKNDNKEHPEEAVPASKTTNSVPPLMDGAGDEATAKQPIVMNDATQLKENGLSHAALL